MNTQGSFVRQTRSKTRATQQAPASGSSQPPRSEEVSSPESNGDVFEPSVIDIEHGDDFDCAECTRPNSADLYMVQCGKCMLWYHFSCAKVDVVTVRSRDFICVKCVPLSRASSKTGKSSTTSSRRAAKARDLQLLEEERCLREKLEEEKLQKEKQIVEKAMNEKLQREKEYLARRHDLLRQQDEDAESMRSSRSNRSQASRSKVEAWIENGSNQPVPVQSVEPVGSSTPFEISEAADEDPNKTLADVAENVILIPRITDSISIREIPRIVDAVESQSNQQIQHTANTSNIPLVNLTPFVRLLDISGQIPKSSKVDVHQKIVPKVTGNPLPYQEWQRETSENQNQLVQQEELRRREQREQELTNLLKRAEEKREQDRQRMKEVFQQQRQNEEKRREQREQELTNHLKRAEDQREQDKQRLLQIEAALRKQHDIGKQYQKQEYDLVQRFKQLEQQFLLERGKRDEERQQFLAHEQGLLEQLKSLRMKSNQQSAAEQRGDHCQYDAPETTQQTGVPVSNYSQTIPNRLERVGTLHTPYVPPRLGQTIPPVVDPLGPSNIHLNPFEIRQGPTPHQLAARQVISRELPVFSRDPIEWPLFISSYHHSTEACGYTESENLLRLQRALKGVAKEAVSSFLLHHSTVPHVLSTLQTLYGRPEQIVHNLVAKVRATAAPKAERLETLI
ncbi:trichohyalin-like [Toxorhynchites rutilus septentrionalis]|uniref:trichohyalin-like n=1 Tax=Toxorhynchites rutilus septentrionalis TaxID=329112 RepID=UPI002479E015|nr:trichohyalin-like [Toxorhynchites rutilus septentrionalis]XP_055617996.1 trichohyalin-like [Toxorhynchites rutilus septentrionalis]